jgi:drug/metabolite transporter (DMT)-like permease
VSILLALASSLLWGVSDYLGGKTSRGRSALVIVMISQGTGLLVALGAAVVTGSLSAPIGYLPWAAGAGLAGVTAVVLFYQALAIGVMGVVAPLAALGVIVPVVIGIFLGAWPSILCLCGIAIAIGGVLATAGATPGGAVGVHVSGHRKSIVLAVGAAIGFGLLQFAISGGARYSTVMTMVGMRMTSVPLLALVVVTIRSAHRSSPENAVAATFGSKRTLAVVMGLGVFDVSANLLFAVATVSGALAVVAVLGSLYPAATVLLARVIDRERMTRWQNIGVLAAIAGVATIAAGS